jgi:DNA-directed RNA polymerase specialized sigma24 family protein
MAARSLRINLLIRRRQRRRPLLAALEAIACDVSGRRLDQRGYRTPSRGATGQENGDGQALVQARLQMLLADADVDLLYLRFVAGWSQADVARERGVHRSTIKRREQHSLAILRGDPALRRLVRLPPFPPEAAVQQSAITCEGTSTSSSPAVGWNGIRMYERRRIAA